MPRLFALPFAALLLANVALALAFAAPAVLDVTALKAFVAHPQAPGGLALSLFTGTASTLLSLLFACLIMARSRRSLASEAGAMLAVPHLAFAVGFVFLIVPTGLLARLFATFVTGWSEPPQWIAAQDPYGLSLTAALVFKETPFLVWVLASLMARGDLQRAFEGQARVARSLGHGPRSVWLRVVLPQLLERLKWPLVAVFTYGTTVVDMALVTGPTQPPTLATVIWKDLNDADPAIAARGAAGALAFSLVIILLLWVVGLLLAQGRSRMGLLYSRYPGTENSPNAILKRLWGLWRLSYGVIAGLLLLQSVSGHWPFPRLLASHFSTAAWTTLLADPAPLATSLVLALTAASAALAAAVMWLEALPSRFDRLALAACALALCLPALVIALGQYRFFLALGVTGTALALFLAHVLPAAAYVFVMLQEPYRGFDPRWCASAAGLGRSQLSFLARIKWPLLKAPLLSAAAVGFAVSMAQFVPAQLAAAGRFSTLPMETVTLASGGNRPLLAASALLLMALPLIAFLVAGRFGRPRWST